METRKALPQSQNRFGGAGEKQDPLFLSRLEFLKAVLWALCFFWFPSMISLTLEHPLYLFADNSTLCQTICHPSDRQAAASSPSADLVKITNWSNTWNMSFNPDKYHSHNVSPKGPSGTTSPPPSPPPIYFLNNPLE